MAIKSNALIVPITMTVEYDKITFGKENLNFSSHWLQLIQLEKKIIIGAISFHKTADIFKSLKIKINSEKYLNQCLFSLILHYEISMKKKILQP